VKESIINPQNANLSGAVCATKESAVYGVSAKGHYAVARAEFPGKLHKMEPKDEPAMSGTVHFCQHAKALVQQQKADEDTRKRRQENGVSITARKPVIWTNGQASVVGHLG
jgi:hypothetical protein